MIKYFIRLVQKLFTMEFLNSLMQDQDMVIRASASTYNPQVLANQGLQITLNLSNQKTRFVGGAENPIYPEIVVWRPDYGGATTGQAVIVEAIETAYTLNSPPIVKWRVLASLGITFNLIVPVLSLQSVRNTLRANNLTTGIILQTHSIDSQNRYTFKTIPNI